MRRDDADRLLIAGGLLWLWLARVVGDYAEAPFQPTGIWYLPAVAGVPVLILLAALLLWRDVAAVRPVLVAVALAEGVTTVLSYPAEPVVGLAIAGGAVLVAIGAARVRVPAGQRETAPPAAIATSVSAGAPPVARSSDLADDPALVAFLDAVAHLAQEPLRVMAAAWKAVDPGDRERAWDAVRREAAATGREDVLAGLREEIEQWGRAAGGSPWTWEFGTMVDVDRSNLRRAAMPALLDAAAAILLRDRLEAADRDALLAPWEATRGVPSPDPGLGDGLAAT